MVKDTEFVTCRNCDTPCYSFELDAKGRIISAFCTVCGNDEIAEFTLSDEDSEPEE